MAMDGLATALIAAVDHVALTRIVKYRAERWWMVIAV
jgi:hypothetical protein